MTLREALKPVSYLAKLQVVELEENGSYKHIFPKDELITRGTIEKFYPELLDRDITNGFHGEGIREGLYVHI